MARALFDFPFLTAVCLSGQRLICEVIDFDEEADTVSIQQGVCDQLDRLRSVLNELPDFLTEASLAALQSGCSWGHPMLAKRI